MSLFLSLPLELVECIICELTHPSDINSLRLSCQDARQYVINFVAMISSSLITKKQYIRVEYLSKFKRLKICQIPILITKLEEISTLIELQRLREATICMFESTNHFDQGVINFLTNMQLTDSHNIKFIRGHDNCFNTNIVQLDKDRVKLSELCNPSIVKYLPNHITKLCYFSPRIIVSAMESGIFKSIEEHLQLNQNINSISISEGSLILEPIDKQKESMINVMTKIKTIYIRQSHRAISDFTKKLSQMNLTFHNITSARIPVNEENIPHLMKVFPGTTSLDLYYIEDYPSMLRKIFMKERLAKIFNDYPRNESSGHLGLQIIRVYVDNGFIMEKSKYFRSSIDLNNISESQIVLNYSYNLCRTDE